MSSTLLEHFVAYTGITDTFVASLCVGILFVVGFGLFLTCLIKFLSRLF